MSFIRSQTLFLSWIGYHGRSAGIANSLGIQSKFISGGSAPVAIRYLRQLFYTYRLIVSSGSKQIIVMQPPAVAILAIMPLCWVLKIRLIADLHTGAFTDRKWKWALPVVLKAIKARGFAIVTNRYLAELVQDAGVHAVILDDVIQLVEPDLEDDWEDPVIGTKVEGLTYALAPLSYAFDEPVSELIAAARQNPELTWVWTGGAPKDVIEAVPGNVVLTGFVSSGDFHRLVSRSSLIVALTLNQNTMQRAGYEALSYGKPLLTSSTNVLHEYFGEAARYTALDAESISEAAIEAIGRSGELGRDMQVLRKAKLLEQENRLSILEDKLQLGS